MSKYPPHVYVIPEDDRDRQIANGFVLHDQVDCRRIQVVPPARGWLKTIETFQTEFVARLRSFQNDHVVMLIDFDGRVEERKAKFEQEIPDDLKDRVFVVGAEDEPETLRKALKMGFEKIGTSLAEDCDAGTEEFWNHEQLRHNDAERQRLIRIVKPFLFQPSCQGNRG